MNDRVWFPVIRLIVDGKSLEEFLLPLKDGFERGDGQRLPEPTRTRKKIGFPGRIDHPPDVFSLINVEIPLADEFFEIRDAAGYGLHGRFSS